MDSIYPTVQWTEKYIILHSGAQHFICITDRLKSTKYLLIHFLILPVNYVFVPSVLCLYRD